MTLQEAYTKAINMPIKDLPKITIQLGSRILYLEEFDGSIELINEPGANDPTFYINTEELMSEKWEVFVGN